MKLVVLDGYTENPGDLSWAELEALGELTVYDRTSYAESPLIAERIGDAEIVVMNKTPILPRDDQRVPEYPADRGSCDGLQHCGLSVRTGKGHSGRECADLRHGLGQPVFHRPSAGDLPPYRPSQRVCPCGQLGLESRLVLLGLSAHRAGGQDHRHHRALAASARRRAASRGRWACTFWHMTSIRTTPARHRRVR